MRAVTLGNKKSEGGMTVKIELGRSNLNYKRPQGDVRGMTAITEKYEEKELWGTASTDRLGEVFPD